MTRVFKALESGSKLAKGFGRIYLLVPEMQRLSRVTTVAGQDEAERLTREVEALEQYVRSRAIAALCHNFGTTLGERGV